MAKRMIYFRGHCYEDTLRNRIVADILTFSYRLRNCFHKLWILFFLTICVSCTSSPVVKQDAGLNDSLYIDSLHISGHSYIYAYDYNSVSLVHNPDCPCRYNRTFIVIKRGK